MHALGCVYLPAWLILVTYVSARRVVFIRQYPGWQMHSAFLIQLSMIDVTKLQFHVLDLRGLRTLVSWAEAEGWNPGVNDAEVFWATDPGGFIGCFYDEELIAGGSIVSYNGDFGFMGFFIVKPQFRASGIGRRL